MGNQLPRCSRTCLPAPVTDEDKAFFKDHGMTFGRILGDEVDRAMRNVYGFPASWRLLSIWDRGDTEHITIVNEEGMAIADVTWRSKKLYCNKASMCRAEPWDRRLNMNAVESVVDRPQFLVQKTETDVAEYYDAANRVYSIQEAGGQQAEIDAAYDAAIALGQKFPADKRLPIERLKSTYDITSNAMAQGCQAIMAMEMVHAIPFHPPERPDLWLPVTRPADAGLCSPSTSSPTA